MRYIYNGKDVTYSAFEDADGIKYPANWAQLATKAQRTNLGIVEQDEPVFTPTTLTLDQKKENKINEINSAFEVTMQQVRAGYPNDEVMSWSKQESDARAHKANAVAVTKLLDTLAEVRGVPKGVFADLIIAKADQYAVVVGQLVGKRQLLETAIENATDETIDAISWQ